MRAALALMLLVAASVAQATNYKYLDSPNRNITYGTVGFPAGSIPIYSYEGKEPTGYFKYTCFSRKGSGPAYQTNSNGGQNCLGNKPPRTTVFAPTSFWYQPIPANVGLHPNSAGFVKDFQRQYDLFYKNVVINTYNYAAPVYTVDANVKPVKVAFNNCQRKTWIDPSFVAQISAVPIPAYAVPAAGSDGEMVVYQPSTDTLWELWVTRKDAAGNWSACWGGKLSNVSKSDGVMPKGYGTTATGLPFMGGQITAEELAAGKIEHAIGISLVDVEKHSIISWPANRSDGYNPTGIPNRVPEGLRFRLDPAVNVDALPMTKVGKIIARAAQTYGFVLWDKAGSISLRANNPIGYTAAGKANPYPELFEGKANYDVLRGFPWDKLQFLPVDYGKP